MGSILGLQIRGMRRGDFESINEINRLASPHVFQLDASEFLLLLDLCEYCKVVQADGETVGYIFVLGKGLNYDGEEYNWFCRNLADEFLYIDQIAIASRWQGMGCGRALYSDLENYAVEKNKTALVCEVNSKPLNETSMAFHLQLGFEQIMCMQARGTEVALLAKRGLRRTNSNRPGGAGRS